MRYGSIDRTLLMPFERLQRKGARGLRTTAFEERPIVMGLEATPFNFKLFDNCRQLMYFYTR